MAGIRVLCIKDFVMDEPDYEGNPDVAFSKGQIYTVIEERSNSVVFIDDNGDRHSMYLDEEFYTHFEDVKLVKSATIVKKVKYLCVSADDNNFIGTLADILDWSFTDGVDLNDCEFYALDKKVKLSLVFEVDSDID